MNEGVVRIAIWSGPRNISTAMLRAWENRDDCFVCDEPLYAHYLEETGLAHPGAAEVIEHHETDWRKVVAVLTGPCVGTEPIFYQKQMAHHLLPQIDRDWLDQLTHAFLIRDPRAMIASYVAKHESLTLDQTGLPQQLEIFERVRQRCGSAPPVVDARDLLCDPPRILAQLCERLGVEFSKKMLNWPAGSRETDGVWARHWYDAVERSTGFQPYRPRPVSLSAEHESLALECEAIYEQLHAHRLTVGGP